MNFTSFLLVAALYCTVCNAAASSGAAGASFAFLAASSALALQPCPPNSKNCILTQWTPPPRSNKATISTSIISIIKNYPPTGQAGIDKDGFTIVEDSLGSRGTARVEFRNLGNFAKLFNGGKPYIDDFVVQINGQTVQVKSSSRIGQSDLGVNKKRLEYFAKELRAKGWTIPDPKY
jgi:uncharacterized protein (DUF1499 family)